MNTTGFLNLKIRREWCLRIGIAFGLLLGLLYLFVMGIYQAVTGFDGAQLGERFYR